MFIVKNLRLLVLAVLFTGMATVGYAQKNKLYYPGKKWEKVDLKAGGWNAGKLKKAQEFADKLNTAGAVVLYRGRILQEFGDLKVKTNVYSVRKSLLSVLYGPAVEAGLIDLSETMGDLGIEDTEPSLSEEEKQATVKMLLQARSGIYHTAGYETKAMTESKPARYSYAPGTFFHYNNWDFNVLGHIYRKKTGTDIFESFKEQIGDPIGMQDFVPKTDGKYVHDRKKSIYPAYPFMMSTRDMARLGLLIERKGRWNNKQVISESWVEESTTTYSDGGKRAGYAYLWWTTIKGVSPLGGKSVSLPHDLISAKGNKGHILAIIPSEEMVFVFNNDNDNGERTSYADIGRLLKLVLDAKEN